MAGLYAPLPTLRRHPHGCLRTARGQCGSLLLHCDGLAPSTPCRSPGAQVIDLMVAREGIELANKTLLFSAFRKRRELSYPRCYPHVILANRQLHRRHLAIFWPEFWPIRCCIFDRGFCGGFTIFPKYTCCEKLRPNPLAALPCRWQFRRPFLIAQFLVRDLDTNQ